MPVYRHQHATRSSVYAFESELATWRAGRRPTNVDPARLQHRPLSTDEPPRATSKSRSLVSEDAALGLLPAIRLAYVLLRLDQLPGVGTWGFTINKYIELNYSTNAQILRQRNAYLIEGSITHTAHALRGLGFLRTSLPGVQPQLIRQWIERHSVNVGFIELALPANPDEARDIAKQVRHTASAILASLRLRAHVSIAAGVAEIERWADARAKLLLRFASVWVHDPEMTYSHAYLLELFDLLRGETRYASLRPELTSQIDHGLGRLFDRISLVSPYWCWDTHRETKRFYTLLILTRILSIAETYREPAWVDRVHACLEDIGRSARGIGGVSLGEGSQESRFGRPDLGATAAFFGCCQQASRFGLPIERLGAEAYEMLRNVWDTFEESAENSITHTWEAIVSLVDRTDLLKSLDSQVLCEQLEPQLQGVVNELASACELPSKAIREIGEAIGCPDRLAWCFERDIWRSAVHRIQKTADRR